MRAIAAYTIKFVLFDIHRKYLRLVYRVAVILSHQFGLGVMLRNLFKPLYGVPGIWNRITGAVFRFFAIITCAFLIFATIMGAISVYPMLIFGIRFLAIYNIGLLITLIILLILVLIYRALYFPIIPIGKAMSDTSLLLSGGGRARNLMVNLRKADKRGLIKMMREDKGIMRFNQLAELSRDIIGFLSDNIQSVEWEKVATKIRELAKITGQTYITAELIYVSILLSLDSESELSHNELTEQDVIDALYYLENLRKKDPNLWSDEYTLSPAGGVDKAWATGYTGVLNRYSVDLTKMALRNEMPRLIGREKTKKEFIAILSKESRNNVLLVGAPGSGKTTFVKAIAREIALGTSIKALRYKRLVSLDIGAITAGTQGEINKRLTDIIKEIEANKNIIVFVDEIENLSALLNTDPNAVSVFNLLEPRLSEGSFQFIGTTTNRDYVKYIEPNQAFVQLFDVVKLPDATKKETILILQEEMKRMGVKNLPAITYPSLKILTTYARRYVSTSVLPNSAVNLLNGMLAKAKDTNVSTINRDYVNDFVSEKTGIPVSKINSSDRDVLENLEKSLHTRIIGQDNAIKQVVKAIKRARAQVRDSDKPIASFLFAGPTGVGKTETAKALAAFYFGDERNIIRLDMSEYQDASSMKRLIGTKDAPVGLLTSAIREKPYSLVLIDEVEKAHKNIQHLFLQVLDDARLTDAAGNVIDFTNTLIIMTSNVGTKAIIKSIKSGENNQKIEELTIRALKEHFALEFLNRFTAVIPFFALTEKEVKEITTLKLEKVKERMAKRRINIKFSEGVVDRIAKIGFSDEWGARELNRVIEDSVETFLAEKIIKGDLNPGDTLYIDKLPENDH